MIQNVTTREAVEQYCDEVLSGDIVACELVTKAVEKYRKEMASIGKHDWPFTFDENKASLAIQFFPMLLRHSVAEWAGQPFELCPWQKFIVWNIFGWQRKDNTRRFRKLFMSVARKNGKSTFCAGLAIMLAAADGESAAQVLIAATKQAQARIIFEECDRMLGQSPHIAKHATRHKANIAFNSTHSYIRPLGSDRSFDGLNPHGCFFDELHEWREGGQRKFYNTMTTGGASRTQPLQVTITTAGDETSYLYLEQYEYAKGVIQGDIRDDSVFAIIYELDKDDDPFADGFDEALMVKSNPCYGISVKPEYISQQLLEYRNKPQSKSVFMRYHANRIVSSVEEAITAKIWDSCSGDLSNWMEADGIGAGVDLGGWDDLASIAYAARFELPGGDENKIYRHEVRTVSFISEDTKRDLSEEPFASWIASGKLIVCRHVISELRDRLLDDCMGLGIEMIAFDPFQAAQLAENLEAEGMKPIKMPQNHSHFNETIRQYLQQVTDGRFKPDINDVVLRWAALNMCLNRNSQDRLMPDKKSSKSKVDPAVAMLMAVRASNAAAPRFKGSYDL